MLGQLYHEQEHVNDLAQNKLAGPPIIVALLQLFGRGRFLAVFAVMVVQFL
jgi:hypothetical protein